MISVSLASFPSGVHAIDVAGATYNGCLPPHPLSAAGVLRGLDFKSVYPDVGYKGLTYSGNAAPKPLSLPFFI